MHYYQLYSSGFVSIVSDGPEALNLGAKLDLSCNFGIGDIVRLFKWMENER